MVLTLFEPLQNAPELITQAQDDSARENLAVAVDPISWEEEPLSLAEEKVQNPAPGQKVALLPTLTEKAEKEVVAAEPSSPAGAKENIPAKTRSPQAGKASPSEFIQVPAGTEKISPDGKNVFRDANLRAQGLSDSLPKDFSSPLPLPREIEWLNISEAQPSALSAIFPSEGNEKVGEFVTFFQQKAGTFFSKALARSQAYEDMMKKIFREKNLPEELFYLALIESGYNPHALSRSKAGGIWQFVAKTAKRFGLKVDKWVDERRDPEKSTYAAAEYLKSLYEMFNCWELATASYNAGEGKISRAMKKAKSQDFWEISEHRYLKKETKRYVPMFLAAVLIAKEPHKYGFSNINYHPPLVYEKVAVPPGTRLDWIAKIAETDLSEIRALNPALKRGKTPPGSSQFEINLPPGKKELFEKNLFAYNHSAAIEGQKHRVRAGETLRSISKRYQVKYQDLCEFNGLSSRSKIKPGTMLLLPP
jgi:membrane-bound lytic murein transglycosylase D